MALTPTALPSLKPRRHHPPATPQQPLAKSLPATPEAYRVMSFPMLSLPSSIHPQHKSLALQRAGRTTVKQTKIQMAAADSSHLHLHSLPLIFVTHTKLLMEQPLCVCDGLHSAVTAAFGAYGIHG